MGREKVKVRKRGNKDDGNIEVVGSVYRGKV